MTAGGGERGPALRYAGEVGRHTSTYGLSGFAGLVSGLASLSIYTRFLSPTEYGRLALLIAVYATLVQLFCLGTLQGTVRLVVGRADPDDDAEDDADDTAARQPGRGLLAGLLVILGIGLTTTAVLVAFSGDVAELVGGVTAGSIWLTGLAAALASVARLAGAMLRVQLRPAAFLLLMLALQFVPLCVAVPLLAGGWGVDAVLVGMVAGSGVAAVAGSATMFGLLRRGIRRGDFRAILSRGRSVVPLVVSYHVIGVADVFVLSRFATLGDLGTYRVASRLGALAAHGTAALNMALGPLRRSALHAELGQRYGRSLLARTTSTYFVTLAFGLVLAAHLLADELLRVIAPAYAGAAPLVALTTAAACARGIYVQSYRLCTFPDRRKWYLAMGPTLMVITVTLLVALVSRFGVIGAPVALLVGWSTGTCVMLLRNRFRGRYSPFDLRSVVIVVVAAVCLGAAGSMHPDSLVLETVLDVVLLAGYGLVVVTLGVIPWSHLSAVAAALRRRRRHPADLA